MQAQQAPDLFELEARFQALQSQRNVALDDAAILAGQLAVARRQIAQLQAQLESLTSKPEQGDIATPT